MFTSLKMDTVTRVKHLDEAVSIFIRGAYDKFPDFFNIGTFIDSTHMKL